MTRLLVGLAGTALLALVAVLVLLVGLLQPPVPAAGSTPPGVPPEYLPHLAAAAVSCQGVPLPVLAAQLEQESGWDPLAVSPKGAQGLGQFLPTTWSQQGVDGDRDGRADPFSAVDAIHSTARYDCWLRQRVEALALDPVPLVLAAYNAGLGRVLAARGLPAIAETRAYVATVLARAAAAATAAAPPAGEADGLTPKALRVREVVRSIFGVSDFGGYASAGHTEGSDHYTGRAVDIMLTPLGPPKTQLGWRIALYLQANAVELEITYLIWQGRIWSPSRAAAGWRPYRHPDGRRDPTALHMDHVHVSVR